MSKSLWKLQKWRTMSSRERKLCEWVWQRNIWGQMWHRSVGLSSWKMIITKLISHWKIGKNREDTFIYLYYIFKRKACPNGKYGNNCQRQCNLNCGVKASCDRITGQCEGGCQTGWKGITCDTRTICLFFVFFSIIVFGFLLNLLYILIKHFNY